MFARAAARREGERDVAATRRRRSPGARTGPRGRCRSPAPSGWPGRRSGRPPPPRPALRRGAEVGHDVHRVRRRAAVAERQQRAAGIERAACQRCGRRPSAAPPSRACAPAGPRSRVAFSSTSAYVLDTPAGSRSPPDRNGYRKHEAPPPAPASPAVLEEDVHELPEHVVQRLCQLLAHERVVARRLEHPVGGAGLERDREAAARHRRRHGRLRAEARSRHRPAPQAAPARPARRTWPAAPACRRSPDARTRRRRDGRPSEPARSDPHASSRPPAPNRSASRRQSCAIRSASRLEETLVGVGAPLEQRARRPDARRALITARLLPHAWRPARASRAAGRRPRRCSR